MSGGSVTPEFQPLVRDERLPDRLAEVVLRSILSRGLQPGDRLPSERELAVQFAVSRTVVREAIRSLIGKGIIESRPGSGLAVAAMNAAAVSESISLFVHANSSLDYRKVHEVREMLEVQVANLAASRATEEEVTQLRRACEQLESVADDVEAASRADLEFHRLLAAATHNELFEILLDAVGAPLWEIRRETFTVPGRPRVAAAAHRAVFDRVAARDAVGARREMRTHLKDVEHAWELLGGPQTSGQGSADRPATRRPARRGSRG